MTLERFKQFIEKANIKHNNKYTYNLDKIPQTVKCKIEIICPDHGVF